MELQIIEWNSHGSVELLLGLPWRRRAGGLVCAGFVNGWAVAQQESAPLPVSSLQPPLRSGGDTGGTVLIAAGKGSCSEPGLDSA